jgi:hypothetical protein
MAAGAVGVADALGAAALEVASVVLESMGVQKKKGG